MLSIIPQSTASCLLEGYVGHVATLLISLGQGLSRARRHRSSRHSAVRGRPTTALAPGMDAQVDISPTVLLHTLRRPSEPKMGHHG